MSNTYLINVEYTIGDSFTTEKCIRAIEYEWKDYERCLESFNRIVEHYKWYIYHNGRGLEQEVPKPPYTHEKYDWSLSLVNDSGEEFDYGTFWCGVFETMRRVEIIKKDMLPCYEF